MHRSVTNSRTLRKEDTKSYIEAFVEETEEEEEEEAFSKKRLHDHKQYIRKDIH